jgi:CheY-like chemotaxis protein
MIYSWAGKKILIVEDNYINCLLFKHMLNGTNIDIIFAKNSKEFFELIEADAYDLILMDVNLGESINGIELIRYLQVNEIITPVFIQSALDDYSFDSFHIKDIEIIRKPINLNELLLKIDGVFK